MDGKLNLFDDTDDIRNLRVAIHAKTKHPDLWPLAQKMGSQVQLARELNVTPTEVCAWIGLKRFPNYLFHPNHWQHVMDKLFALTGKTFEELWPVPLQLAINGGNASAETTRVMLLGDMEYRTKTTERLTAPQPSKAIEDKEDGELIESLLKFLPARKREIIRLRYGINSDGPLSLGEIGKRVDLTSERVRGIVMDSIRHLQKVISINHIRFSPLAEIFQS